MAGSPPGPGRLHRSPAGVLAVMLVLAAWWNPQGATASTVKPPTNRTQDTTSGEGLVITTEATESPERSHSVVPIGGGAPSATPHSSLPLSTSPSLTPIQELAPLSSAPPTSLATSLSSQSTSSLAPGSLLEITSPSPSLSKGTPSQTAPLPILTPEPTILTTSSEVLLTNTSLPSAPRVETSSLAASLSSLPATEPVTSTVGTVPNTTLVTPTYTVSPLITTPSTAVVVASSATTPTNITLLLTTPTIATTTVQTTTPTTTTTTTTTTNKQPTTSSQTTTMVAEGQTSSATSAQTQSSSVEPTTASSTVAATTPKGTTIISPSTLPTTVPSTTETPLNTSDAFKEFWVKTVIAEDRSVDVSAPQWLSDMETRLAGIYDDGFTNLKEGRRRRRATTVGETTLQMVNASRDSVGGKNVTMLYYMERYGNATPALSAVAAIDTFEVQEIALRLGKVVIVKAEVYAPPVYPPPHDSKLWLIGAISGGTVGFILLVWCVLFIYCKCTRPVKTHQRTPRTPRSTRISMTGEYTDTNSYRNKMPKIQGFDIARTEVGLENEIQRDLKRKPGGTDSYRRHPDGSTELEGMYSTGDTPPPKPMGYSNTPPGRIREAGEGEEGQTQTLNRNKSRSHIPIDSSLRRSLPPRPDTSQETLHPPKKKAKKKQAESEESDSEDDRLEDRQPLSPEKQEKSKKSKKKMHKVRNEDKARVKGKHKKKKNHSDNEDDDHDLDSSQAALYENVAKMTRGIGEVKLRSTQHAIRLPPLITQPLVGDVLTRSLREETELQESLQQKADIERWRNKQRHRERTKGSKGSHQESIDL